MVSDNMRGRNIHEVPAVDTGSARKIKTINRFLQGFLSAPVLFDQYQESCHPLFVVGRMEQIADIVTVRVAVIFDDFPDLRDNDSMKPIAFSILSRAGPEKAG
jgi:hypothetical protein